MGLQPTRVPPPRTPMVLIMHNSANEVLSFLLLERNLQVHTLLKVEMVSDVEICWKSKSFFENQQRFLSSREMIAMHDLLNVVICCLQFG